MKVNIGEIKVKQKINIGEIRIGVKKLYSSSGDVEDLNNELTEQDELITEQEVTIENIISALEGKSVSGGGISPKVEGNMLILSSVNIEGGVLSI